MITLLYIRNITDLDEEDLKAAFSSFCDIGFINYFGMQRFGSNKTCTYEIGKALLARRWSVAIDVILSSLEGKKSMYSL